MSSDIRIEIVVGGGALALIGDCPLLLGKKGYKIVSVGRRELMA